MDRILNYGCVGAGGIADKKALLQYSSAEHVVLAALCDPNREKASVLAQKYGIPHVYDDYREMLKQENLDIVDVCTPNTLHEPVTVSALQHGCHVHCEKPMAVTVEKAESILEAKNRYGKKVIIGFNKRFTQESQMVKRLVLEGFFGELYQVQCGWKRRAGIPGRGSWFTQKECSGGGALIDIGVHILDLVSYFLDYPAVSSVSAATYQKFADNPLRNRSGYAQNPQGIFDVEDLASGFIRFQNGASVGFEFSWASNIEEETCFYELKGTKGGVYFKNDEIRFFSELGGACVDIFPKFKKHAKTQNESEHFIDCILNDKEPISTPEQSVYLIRLIDACYRSAQENDSVRME